MASKAKLDPLREFLDAVVTRIENLETHCGIDGKAVAVKASGDTAVKHHETTLEKTPSARHISGEST